MRPAPKGFQLVVEIWSVLSALGLIMQLLPEESKSMNTVLSLDSAFLLQHAIKCGRGTRLMEPLCCSWPPGSAENG